MTQANNLDQSAYEDFVPAKPANYTGGSGDGVPRNFPVPKGGPRRARISLIVDLGIQARGDIYKTADGTLCREDTPGAIATPQKDAPQVAVFADLVSDTVDYGGDIGKAHYRLLLNGTFSGVIKGVNHEVKTPPKDAKGQIIKGAPWTMHPNNLLSKLAVATGTQEIMTTGAINRLLGKQFVATVEVNEKASSKMDADGNEIIYKNVNYKSGAQVAPDIREDDDGNEIEVIPEFAQLKTPAMLISFTNAKKENIKYIRPSLIKMIKLATNYAGSNMEKAIQAYEAERAAGNADDDGNDAPAEQPAKPAAKPKAEKPKAPVEQDDDDQSPF